MRKITINRIFERTAMRGSIVLKSVHYLRYDLDKRYFWNKGKHYRIMVKLDPVKDASYSKRSLEEAPGKSQRR